MGAVTGQVGMIPRRGETIATQIGIMRTQTAITRGVIRGAYHTQVRDIATTALSGDRMVILRGAVAMVTRLPLMIDTVTVSQGMVVVVMMGDRLLTTSDHPIPIRFRAMITMLAAIRGDLTRMTAIRLAIMLAAIRGGLTRITAIHLAIMLAAIRGGLTRITAIHLAIMLAAIRGGLTRITATVRVETRGAVRQTRPPHRGETQRPMAPGGGGRPLVAPSLWHRLQQVPFSVHAVAGVMTQLRR